MTRRSVSIARFALAMAAILMLTDVDAQCVMCKAVAEDSAAEGAVGRGINQGILYIMAVPYMLIGIFGFFVVKKWNLVE
ncbi:hypothetical protein OAO65_03225 [Flavobacteriales bacterium]|nr:hypothetical protein [Flavobacteriales bacterium]